MKRKAISIIIIVVVLALLAGGGFLLYYKLSHNVIVGRVEFGKAYQLREVRPGAFANVTAASQGYFKINGDQKTGEIYLEGLDAGKLKFIVTDYREGTHHTTIDIEYIYQNNLYQLTAESTDTAITFKTSQRYRVAIAQENPDDTQYLEYNSTILVFVKEVA